MAAIGGNAKIPTTIIAPTSADPFPCLDNLWSVYAKKGSRTIFLTLGASVVAAPDLEIAETLGCPINIVPVGEDQRTAWAEVAECIKSRSRDVSGASPFSEGAEEKWILPKNFHILDTLPLWGSGTQDVSGVPAPVRTEAFSAVVESICRRMALKDSEVRLDILKLDVPAGLERSILYAMLEGGFRPGLVLVRWNKMPDTDVPTTLCAGHLQNCGYSLVATEGNKFAYFFIDRDLYMTCSWEDTSVPNPLVKEVVTSVRNSMKRIEEFNNHAKRLHSDLSSGEEAAHQPSDEKTADGS